MSLPLDPTFRAKLRDHVHAIQHTVQHIMREGFVIDYRTREALFQPDPVKTVQYIERLMLPRVNGAVQSGLIRCWEKYGRVGIKTKSFEAFVARAQEFYSDSAVFEAQRRIEAWDR